MIHLIKKDLIIHYFSWFIYIGLIVFFTVFNKDTIFIIALISAVVMMNLFYFDEEANGYKLWISLPYRRSEIVTSRYASLLVVTAIVTLLVLLFNWQFNMVIWLEVIGGFITILITAAICFPLFYLFAQQRVMVFLLMLYIVLVIGVVHGIYYLYIALFDISFIAPYLTNSLFYVTTIAIGMIVYGLSWIVSLKIFDRKEII